MRESVNNRFWQTYFHVIFQTVWKCQTYLKHWHWAGEGRAPGRASDYTLRAPNPLDSRAHDQTFYQDFGAPNWAPGILLPCPPLLPALH